MCTRDLRPGRRGANSGEMGKYCMTVSCACPAGDEAQGAGKENPRKSGSPLTRAPSIRPLTWSGHGLGLCPVARRLGAPRCPCRESRDRGCPQRRVGRQCSSFAVPSCLLTVAPKVKLVGPGAADASPKTKTGGSGAGGGSCAPSVLRGACSSTLRAAWRRLLLRAASLLLSLPARHGPFKKAIIYASMRFRLRRCREFSVAAPSGSLDAVRVAGRLLVRRHVSQRLRPSSSWHPGRRRYGEGDPDSVTVPCSHTPVTRSCGACCIAHRMSRRALLPSRRPRLAADGLFWSPAVAPRDSRKGVDGMASQNFSPQT